MSHLETFATAIQINEQDITCNSLTYSQKDDKDTKVRKKIQEDIQEDMNNYYSDIIAFYSQKFSEKQQQQLKINERQSTPYSVEKNTNSLVQQNNYLTNILDKLPKSRFNDISISQTVVQDSVKPSQNQVIIHCNYDYETQLKEHENIIIKLLKELQNSQKIIQQKDERYEKLMQQQIQNEKIIAQQGLELQLLQERLVYADALIQKFNLLQTNPTEATYKNQIATLNKENYELKQKITIQQQQILNYQLQNKLNSVKSIRLDSSGYEYDTLLKSLRENSPYYNYINSHQKEQIKEEPVKQNGYFDSCKQIKEQVENQVITMTNK